MLIVCLIGLIGAFLTSYTRARAEALGLDAKVGMLQRPERVVLLSAPQAFFGLVFNGWVLAIIIIILTVTAWITVVQRVAYVYTATTRAEEAEARARDRGIGLGSGRATAPRALCSKENRFVQGSAADAPSTPRPATGKLGILTPGLGAVATTFMAGVESVRRGLASRSARSRRWRRSASASAPRIARR